MLFKQINKWLKLDQTCLLCGAKCDHDQRLCLPCEEELPWLSKKPQCSCCALPLQPTEGPLCTSCQLRTPAFTRVEAAWTFDFPIDSLISRFKHQVHWPTGKMLTDYLAQHLEYAYLEGLPQPEALIPVPMSKQRLRQRGFNQTAFISHWLGKKLGCPVDEELIQRSRDTTSQQQLNAQERQHNLQGAFQLQQKARKYRHLALVDDVMTTGATGHILAQTLLDAGVQRIDLYCLARTPRPEKQSNN